MRALLPGGVIKAARCVKSLAEVASASDRHALVVQTAWQTCLQGNPANYPRDFAKLLSLLMQLTLQLETSVSDADCQTALSEISGTGPASKLAKHLLAFESGAASNKIAAAKPARNQQPRGTPKPSESDRFRKIMTRRIGL